jgi:threonylcarbamoyladenosine tRNA methylthiotransferase CDKAL1
MRAYLETYGCSLNKGDSDIILGYLKKSGVDTVNSPEKADLLFLNTCAVKLTTERRMISRIQRLSKFKGKLVICGCLPKMNEPEIRKACKDCILVDTNSLDKIPNIVEGNFKDYLSEQHEEKLKMPHPKPGLTAVVPVAEGCLGNCSFCGTKFARGKLTSYPVKDIKLFCERAIENGTKQFYLTAQDTGIYGSDIGSSLPELVKEIASIHGEFKIRIGMMNPGVAMKCLDAFDSPKVYRFLHTPVQSGSDKVLREMNRTYEAKDFIEAVNEFRNRHENACISTDVIVGYPTETDEDFKETVDLITKTQPDVTNVSKFMPRPGTKAAKLKKRLPTETIKERSVEMSRICRNISLRQNQNYVGRTMKVLVCEKGRTGGFIGRAENYKQVALEDAKLGTFREVEIKSAFPTYLSALNNTES